MSEMNVELLERIKLHILAEPRRLRMEAWCVSTHMTEEDRDEARFNMLEELYAEENNADEEEASSLGFGELLDFPPCGTVACIAGWGALLSQPDPDAALKDPALLHELYYLSQFESASRFGLDLDAAERLFHVIHWPEEFAELYNEAADASERANAVVARIDHFVKTKGAE